MYGEFSLVLVTAVNVICLLRYTEKNSVFTQKLLVFLTNKNKEAAKNIDLNMRF